MTTETHEQDNDTGMTPDGMVTQRMVGVTVDGYTTRVEEKKGVFLIPPPLATDASKELPATAIVSMADVVAASKEPSGVYYITDPLLLECVVKYPTLTLGHLSIIAGYPSSVYGPDFNDATFNLPSISYNELLLDVASARRAEAALEADLRHQPETRDKLTTRDSGYKKHFDSFAVHGLEETSDRSDGSDSVDADE